MKSVYNTIKENYKDLYLYKRDIDGNVIYWKADVALLNDNYVVRSFYGRATTAFKDDKAKAISEPIYGTNYGKSNATSNAEQSYKVLESEYKNHIKKGYKRYDNISGQSINYLNAVVDTVNTDALGFAQPMKFKPFLCAARKYPYLGQYKYNGVRCTQIEIQSFELFVDTIIQALSKEGVNYIVPHLHRKALAIIQFIEKNYNVKPILDGEYYIPSINVTSISGAAKNNVNPLHNKLQYIIYDLAIDGYTQLERLDMLNEARKALNISFPDNNNLTPDVFISDYIIINNDDEAIQWLDKALALKWEGMVFRPFDKEYAFGQRPIWNRKLKRFQDAEFEILDVIEYGTRGQAVGYGCKFVCRNDINDEVFEATVGGNDGTNNNTFTAQDKQNLVDNKENIIGKKATVKFYERTINGLPFHHNAIAIRDYE